MKYLLTITAALLMLVASDADAGKRKAGKRDYRETLSIGVNRNTGHREVVSTVHAGKRNQGLKAEGMDRFGISELPVFGGRAPRPDIFQPDLQNRTDDGDGYGYGGEQGGRRRAGPRRGGGGCPGGNCPVSYGADDAPVRSSSSYSYEEQWSEETY